MQIVESAFTAEAKASSRSIANSVQVSWKKSYLPSIVSFTIGVSLIGSNDVIAGSGEDITQWNKYVYSDESDHVKNLSYSRQLNLPAGGLVSALANVELDNTSNRFTPSYAGGMSEISTAILPRRPIIINSGFNYNSIQNTIPQFVGVLKKQPKVNMRDRQANLEAIDFIDFIANKKVDTTVMYTGIRSDQLIENYFANYIGLSTAEYELDIGKNTIDFAMVESGDNLGNFLNAIAQAENAHIYQDETGTIRFENRTHWSTVPYNQTVAVIYTADVLDAEVPNSDNIVNVVDISATPRAKASATTIYTLSAPFALGANGTTEFWVDFDNPILQVTNRSFTANANEDGSGANLTANVSIKSVSTFARAEKITFNNTSSQIAYLTALTITGRAAVELDTINVRVQDDSSVTAYEEKVITYNNNYIQTREYAYELGASVLSDYSEPDDLIDLRIRARPELQLGDQISWQGRAYNIFGIDVDVDPSAGFVQDLKLVKSTQTSVFTIGISTIGGGDVIG